MKNKSLIGLALIVVFFLLGYHFWTAVRFDIIKYVKIAGQNVKVDLALTLPEQERGLSGRIGLKENEGMLFVFAKPDKYFFWMRDMNFPLDMIWIGENLKVIYVKKDARPELYPESYGPDKEAKYVLEISAGFSDKNNLKVEDSVLFTY